MIDRSITGSLVCAALGLISPLAPPAAADQATAEAPSTTMQQSESVASKVDRNAAERVAQRRKEVLAEAVIAVEESKRALTALEEDRPDEALDALAVATGKLELVLARDLSLVMAPVDVDIRTHDLNASVDAIEATVGHAEDLLGDGQIQQARSLMRGLASEIVISTTRVPLGTYPAAIKSAVPQIDRGEFEAAKAVLSNALGILVVSDVVIPLPMLRAEILLDEARSLVQDNDEGPAANSGPGDDTAGVAEPPSLSELMAAVREQLALAQALGYGNEQAFEWMYERLGRLEDPDAEEKADRGWFDALKAKVSEMI